MVANADRLEGTARDLTIVRLFDAPRELVWSLWTNPEHTVRWMGPRDHPATLFEQDVRVGGKWRGRLQSVKDSNQALWQGGEYLEIVPPEKLVFTFAWAGGPETIVTVILTQEDEKTRMVFHQTPFESADNRDGHGSGWNSAFDRLVDVITKPVVEAILGKGAAGRVSGVDADRRAAEQRTGEDADR